MKNRDLNLEALTAEQEPIQRIKYTYRTLAAYDQNYLFVRASETTHASPVTTWLQEQAPGVNSIVDLLGSLSIKHADSDIIWADMAAGHSLALREAARKLTPLERFRRYGVDLFAWQSDDLSPQNRDSVYVRSGADVYDETLAPVHIQADAGTVVLPEKPHVITSIEGIQYLPNPISAVTNWYNQLADDGLLVVASNTQWSDQLHRRDSNMPNPAIELTQILQTASIPHETANSVWPSRRHEVINTLAIQKLPGTELTTTAPIVYQALDEYDYRVVIYGGVGPVAEAA